MPSTTADGERRGDAAKARQRVVEKRAVGIAVGRDGAELRQHLGRRRQEQRRRPFEMRGEEPQRQSAPPA